jgi:hypothetical protein
MKKISDWLVGLFENLWEFFKKTLKDRITRWVFVIVYLVMTSEVWLFYILGIIFKNGWLLGVASASLAFWLAPGTPLIPLCLGITAVIRTIIRKIRRENDEESISSL